MGNPLLDIQVNSEEILKKYKLKANDATLAQPEHAGMSVPAWRNHNKSYARSLDMKISLRITRLSMWRVGLHRTPHVQLL